MVTNRKKNDNRERINSINISLYIIKKGERLNFMESIQVVTCSAVWSAVNCFSFLIEKIIIFYNNLPKSVSGAVFTKIISVKILVT